MHPERPSRSENSLLPLNSICRVSAYRCGEHGSRNRNSCFVLDSDLDNYRRRDTVVDDATLHGKKRTPIGPLPANRGNTGIVDNLAHAGVAPPDLGPKEYS